MMPCDYKNYHPEWKSRIRPDILSRAGQVRDERGAIEAQALCEKCGVENNGIGWRDEHGRFHELEKSFAGDMYAADLKEQGYKIIKIILTIAHLDHNTANNDYNNLAAWCQRCHNSYDVDYRKANRKQSEVKRKKLLNLF